MDIQQLKGFIAVASEKSFSNAAKKTFRTQSAVSLQIKALEEELETRLFDRIGRKTSLTKDGEALFELASPLVRDLETLGKRFAEKRGSPGKGELRIATQEPILTHLLPGPIRAIKKKYPGVRITVARQSNEATLASVLAGDADIGIASPKKVPPSIDYRVIGRFNRVLVGPKDCPLAKKKSVNLEDIAGYPLLLPPTGSTTRKAVDQAFRAKGLDYNLALEASGRQAIKTYIEMGFGLSVLNASLISEEDRKKFFIADVSKFFGNAERGILNRKSLHPPRYVLDFIEILKTSTA